MKPTEPDTPIQVDISGRRLARNTALNLAGRVVPLLVAIFTVPYVIHHLGPDRYGLLALAGIVVGYFGIFNLGIGPATTKFVAELLGKGEMEKLPQLVWTAFVSQTLLGVAGGVVLAAASPLLADRLLKIPAEFHPQARVIFVMLAFALPIDFASGSMQGVLGASQRFDLLNAVRVPSSCLTSLLPVVVLALGYGLPAIVFFLVLARFAGFAVITLFCLRLYPALRRVRFDFRLVRSLLGFGGWVAVTGAIGPVLRYTDRIFIGALVSVAAVGYYSVAFRASIFIVFIPGALGGTLLPAFSTLQGAGDTARTTRLFLRSYKYVFLVTTPILITLIVFARNIFTLWIGGRFAAEATLPFQILAVGMVVALFGPVANALLQGRGRPDIVTKIYLLHLPINTVVVWAMVTYWGMPGAALSATIRSILDAVLLFFFCARLSGLSLGRLVNRDTLPVLGAVTFSLLLVAFGWMAASQPIVTKSLLFAATMAAFGFVALKFALGGRERRSLWGGFSMLGSVLGRGERAFAAPER